MLRSEPLLTAYDQACRTFRTMRGVRPTALQLHGEGWVEAPPRDLLGYDIELDEDCVARTEVIIIREAEAARERVGGQRHVLPPSLPDDLSSEEFEPPEP